MANTLGRTCEGLGKVIVVVSGKGGTGKTSLSAGVSSALALMGRRVLAVDADAGLRNLDIVLGMDGEMLLSFADVVLKRCTLSDAVKRHPTIANLSMVPAPAVEMPRGVDGAGVLRFVSEAAARFDFVLVDCPAGIGGHIDMFASVCDLAIVVATPDNASLRGAQRTAQALMESSVLYSARLVVNRVRPKMIRKGYSLNIDDAMDEAGLPLLGIVPEDEFVIASANAAKPLLTARTDGAARAYTNIARRICGERVPLLRL